MNETKKHNIVVIGGGVNHAALTQMAVRLSTLGHVVTIEDGDNARSKSSFLADSVQFVVGNHLARQLEQSFRKEKLLRIIFPHPVLPGLTNYQRRLYWRYRPNKRRCEVRAVSSRLVARDERRRRFEFFAQRLD